MEQVYNGTSHLLPERMMEALAMMAPSRSLLSQAEKRMGSGISVDQQLHSQNEPYNGAGAVHPCQGF